MNSLSNVKSLLSNKNVDTISAKILPDSGTGYLYPMKLNEPIVSFTDDANRSGYIFQLSIVDNITNEHTLGNFIIHERYTEKPCAIIYTGCRYLESYVDSCRIKDEIAFLQDLRILIDGDTLHKKQEQTEWERGYDVTIKLPNDSVMW